MSISLQEIEDLSVEVKSLVAANLPLERNLADAGHGYGRRLKELTSFISDHLSQGGSLEEAIRADNSAAPRMLTAAVAAGLRSGNLASSIEVLGDMAHDIVELRRRVLQSVSYPLLVMGLAVVLFSVYIRGFLARVRIVVIDDFQAPANSLLVRLLELDHQCWWWPWLFPAAGVLCLAVWVLSGRAASMNFRGPERALLWLPGVRGMVRDLQFYNLTRMLCLMVERNIPLPESLELAGACSGNDGLDQACCTAAAQISAGSTLEVDERPWSPGQLPPLVATCLVDSSAQGGGLHHRLLGVAGFYRRRLQTSLAWLRNIVPVAMFVIIGGGSVVAYGMTVFWPVTQIYYLLSP